MRAGKRISMCACCCWRRPGPIRRPDPAAMCVDMCADMRIDMCALLLHCGELGRTRQRHIVMAYTVMAREGPTTPPCHWLPCRCIVLRCAALLGGAAAGRMRVSTHMRVHRWWARSVALSSRSLWSGSSKAPLLRCLCACLCARLYARLYTCLHTCPHTRLYTCLHKCLRTCLHTCLHRRVVVIVLSGAAGTGVDMYVVYVHTCM